MSHSRKLRAIILGIFDKKQHNRQYMRLCYKYLPGKIFKKWIPNNKSIQQLKNQWKFPFLGSLFLSSTNQNIKCHKANMAAMNGHLYIVKYLETHHKIYCNDYGADTAACGGHLHIIQYLYQHQGIKCTSEGADIAANRGHLHIIQYLYQRQSIKCTDEGADEAARNGHLHIVQYLYQHQGIKCTNVGLYWATQQKHMHVAEYLQKHEYSKYKSGWH